ncbi:MAG TPA: hypothetical protein VKM93_28130 [Terriglobia bacterium]|nr:hypothetical protein [Terriglobia bacterium]
MNANGKTAELSDVECACHCGDFLSQAMADAGRKYIRGHKSNGNGNGRPDILAKVRKASEKIVQKVSIDDRLSFTEGEADELWLKLKPEIKVTMIRGLVCRKEPSGD